ncbi:hypothetical protein Btru_063302 [Bulinus truncatus]|nr:hypothetical protein Btru_063302 [Bulinus truncatus]
MCHVLSVVLLLFLFNGLNMVSAQWDCAYAGMMCSRNVPCCIGMSDPLICAPSTAGPYVCFAFSYYQSVKGTTQQSFTTSTPTTTTTATTATTATSATTTRSSTSYTSRYTDQTTGNTSGSTPSANLTDGIKPSITLSPSTAITPKTTNEQRPTQLSHLPAQHSLRLLLNLQFSLQLPLQQAEQAGLLKIEPMAMPEPPA